MNQTLKNSNQDSVENVNSSLVRGRKSDSGGGDVTSQFLTFTLNEEVFGLGIMYVKEILEYRELTDVPMTPAFIRGVINLRGNVVPVIDLNVRFGGKRNEISKKTCIIIVEATHEGEKIDVGLLVDAVNEVLDIPLENIEPPPQFGSNLRVDFISGMGNVNNRFIILLNQNRVLSINELANLGELAQKAEIEQPKEAKSFVKETTEEDET